MSDDVAATAAAMQQHDDHPLSTLTINYILYTLPYNVRSDLFEDEFIWNPLHLMSPSAPSTPSFVVRVFVCLGAFCVALCVVLDRSIMSFIVYNLCTYSPSHPLLFFADSTLLVFVLFVGHKLSVK